MTYRPTSGTFDPGVCADALLTLARTKFTNVGLNVVEPIALLNAKQNIGVIMPCAYDEKQDETTDYLETRQAYVAALNITALNVAARRGKATTAVAATPVIEPKGTDPAEFGDTLDDAPEPISIETLQAQLTALLAQCA